MTPRGFLPASGRFVTHPSAHADAPRVMRSTILYVGWASRAEARRCQSYSSRRGDVAAAGARNKRLPLPHRRITARATWVTGATTPPKASMPGRRLVTVSPHATGYSARNAVPAASRACSHGHHARSPSAAATSRPARGPLATNARRCSRRAAPLGGVGRELARRPVRSPVLSTVSS